MTNKIYLDYAATTPLDPRVQATMMPYFSDSFGNPSSVHFYGQQGEAAVENARSNMADGFNCSPEEIIFTSCGTESDNLALRGASFLSKNNRNANHILISPVEHEGVSKTAEQLAHFFDFELEYLPVNQYGQVDPIQVVDRIKPETAIVSVIYGNNEIGSVNPIADIGQICRENNVLFHTDAVQAAAHLPINTKELNVDLIAFGAHKLYGPKGIGAIYIREGVDILPIVTGGGQENGMRAGTSNVPLIVGQAEAFSIMQKEYEANNQRMTAMRDYLIGTILEEIPDTKLTGHPTERLPNHASFVFKGIDGNELLMHLDMEGFACSSGSACKTGNPEPSKVLTAIGIDTEWALGSLRVSLGKNTTNDELALFIDTLPKVIERMRKLESR